MNETLFHTINCNKKAQKYLVIKKKTKKQKQKDNKLQQKKKHRIFFILKNRDCGGLKLPVKQIFR
jgi:hypothetical protein